MSQASKVYVVILFVFSMYIPLVILFYCYGFLVKGMYVTKNICAADTDEDRRSEKKKLVVTFIAATTGFAIGYTPILTFFTVLALESDGQIDSKLYANISSVFYFLFYFSLCLNPISYAFRSTNFQVGFKRIILCRKPTEQNEIQLE